MNNLSDYLPRFRTWLSGAMKRSFDCVFSLVGLILVSPFLGLIALAIRNDSPGPIFYSSYRVGHRGRLFRILKFRTMYEGPESNSGPKVTAHDDPRITKIGRWLRDTKLNELPQLWNVLRGDMSLVGPRPEDPNIVEFWPQEVKEEILSVRPGITSPASVEYRNEEFLLSYANILPTYFKDCSPNKMRIDQLYVRYHTFWLDLDSIFWTLLLLLPKIGANTPPEEFLFVGPFTRLVRQYIPWFAIDILVTFAAIGSAGIIWRVSGPLDVGWPKSIAVGLGYALLSSLSGAILGVNRISWAKATIADGFDLLPGWILATTIAYIVNRVSGIFPSGMVLSASVLALFGYAMVRYRTRLLSEFTRRYMHILSREKASRERVLIIGGEVLVQHAIWMLTHPTNVMKYWIVGLVDDDLFKQGTRIYGVNVVGMVKDIPKLAKEYDVGVIILAEQHNKTNGYHSIIQLCKKTNAKLLVLPDFLTAFNSFSPVSNLFPIPKTSAAREDEMDCLRCMSKFNSTTAETIVEREREEP